MIAASVLLKSLRFFRNSRRRSKGIAKKPLRDYRAYRKIPRTQAARQLWQTVQYYLSFAIGYDATGDTDLRVVIRAVTDKDFQSANQ